MADHIDDTAQETMFDMLQSNTEGYKFEQDQFVIMLEAEGIEVAIDEVKLQAENLNIKEGDEVSRTLLEKLAQTCGWSDLKNKANESEMLEDVSAGSDNERKTRSEEGDSHQTALEGKEATKEQKTSISKEEELSQVDEGQPASLLTKTTQVKGINHRKPDQAWSLRRLSRKGPSRRKRETTPQRTPVKCTVNHKNPRCQAKETETGTLHENDNKDANTKANNEEEEGGHIHTVPLPSLFVSAGNTEKS